MTVKSQNGWPAKANTDTFTRFQAAGRGWWAANKDVAVIFTDWIEWFDNNIESVTKNDDVLDDWSYANRLVRGSTSTVSNHGSATAVDINATKHPRGVENTFSSSDRKKIRAKLKDYDGAIRWGGDYTTTVDDMHFEINVSAAKAKTVANDIRERDMFTDADKKWLSAEIAKQVSAVLTSAEIVPNRPLDPETPQGANWTVAAVLAAGDLKADRANRDLQELKAGLVKP